MIKPAARAVLRACPGIAFRHSSPVINPTLDHHLCTGEKHENGTMATTVSTEPCSSKLEVVPLKGAFNLDTVRSKDGELRTGCKNVNVTVQHAVVRPSSVCQGRARERNTMCVQARRAVQKKELFKDLGLAMWDSNKFVTECKNM